MVMGWAWCTHMLPFLFRCYSHPYTASDVDAFLRDVSDFCANFS
jgi:hypothetical protein